MHLFQRTRPAALWLPFLPTHLSPTCLPPTGKRSSQPTSIPLLSCTARLPPSPPFSMLLLFRFFTLRRSHSWPISTHPSLHRALLAAIPNLHLSRPAIRTCVLPAVRARPPRPAFTTSPHIVSQLPCLINACIYTRVQACPPYIGSPVHISMRQQASTSIALRMVSQAGGSVPAVCQRTNPSLRTESRYIGASCSTSSLVPQHFQSMFEINSQSQVTASAPPSLGLGCAR